MCPLRARVLSAAGACLLALLCDTLLHSTHQPTDPPGCRQPPAPCRRIVAVTGEEAEAAIALADDLVGQVAAAGALPLADMPAEVKALTQTVSGGWAGQLSGSLIARLVVGG